MLMIPEEFTILCVQMQYNAPCIWAEVNHDAPLIRVPILTIMTGDPRGPVGDYIGTVQLDNGTHVLHVYRGRG